MNAPPGTEKNPRGQAGTLDTAQISIDDTPNPARRVYALLVRVRTGGIEFVHSAHDDLAPARLAAIEVSKINGASGMHRIVSLREIEVPESVNAQVTLNGTSDAERPAP